MNSEAQPKPWSLRTDQKENRRDRKQAGKPDRPSPRKEDMVTENYSFRLDAERRSKLQSIAKKQDRDMAYIIRKAIDEYIKRHENEASD